LLAVPDALEYVTMNEDVMSVEHPYEMTPNAS
jgi:hypothetical protein